VGPPDINIHNWEVCHREIRITVSSGFPDTFDQIVYDRSCRSRSFHPTLYWQCFLRISEYLSPTTDYNPRGRNNITNYWPIEYFN
jgi:hypothetical protein